MLFCSAFLFAVTLASQPDPTVASGGSRALKAVQLDLARQMETVPFVKSFVDKVSDAGYNALFLYLEGRVATKTFALPPGECYAPDQIREIVAHATAHGVDVIPCVSVLGHAEHFFQVPGRDNLAEERFGKCRWEANEKQTFCATSPEARAFLAKYLAEVAALFPGRNFHAGLDESWQFGFCPTCSARRREIGFGPLFTEHVKWAHGVLAKLGKRMWMWDDMYEFFPEELVNVPKDVVMCMWIYDDDVTEWGHRGHFLNRIRVDWLSEYGRLGLDAIPVGAACRDNLRTLGDYAARHATLGFCISQWEMSDSFFGVPMANVVGVERAYPGLTPVQRQAVEALGAKWSYFGRGNGVGWSRARHGDALVADRNPDANELESIRLAVEVLKGCASHPGTGPVPSDPLSEAALVDDLVTHFSHLLFWHELDAIAPHLVTPRRTASESLAAKAKLRALLPEMERIAARRAEQQKVWRAGVHAPKGGLAAPVRDHISFAEKLLAQPDVAPADDWTLGLSLSLPDYHGIPKWTVSGRFGDRWRVLAQGTYKPGRGDGANFERKIPFKASEPPSALRIELKGYGEGLLLYAHVWNRDSRFVPEKLLSAEGVVQNPEYVLRDDYMPVRFGHIDRKAVFLNPEKSEEGGAIEVSLRPALSADRRQPSLVFDRDFRTAEGDPSLDGFRIVRHYDGVGKDAIRQAQGYGIAFPLRGNIHLAAIPGSRDCTVDCSMFCDPSFGDSVGFDVYYRYDESTRVGGVLGVTLDRKAGRAKVKSGIVRKLSYAWADEAEVGVRCDGSSGTFGWQMELDGRTVRFGSAAFAVPEGVPSAGGIGFDKFQPSAPLVIGRLSVAGEPAKSEEAFPPRAWRFPRTALCSMSDWRFVFAATNSGPRTVLSAAVEGGPAEAFNRKIGYTRLLPNEAMDRPWFAVVKADGTVGPRQYLHFGRIGLRENWHHELPFMGKADVECPVRRTYVMDRLSRGDRLLIGFDGFASEDRRYIGSPRKMMLVDPASGATVAVGDVPAANGLAVEVGSGRGKEICGMIPKSTPDYDEALDYAARNHFFLEDEAARFAVGVRYGTDRHAVAADLAVECTLQDAFKDPMRTLKGTVTPSASAFPGEGRLAVEVEPLTLPIGVYHLGVEVKARGETLLRKSVAFEVMGRSPDAPRAQMASGLPEMMSPICDYQSESNVSDYRGMGGNDLTHYFAINGMQVLPTVEKDDWGLNRLYRRRYFGWFLHNLVPERKPEAFKDSFKDIDYLCTELVAPTRLEVCSPGAYKGEVRKALADFLRGRCAEGSELGRFAADGSVPMTVPLLKELFERFGQEWMDRAAEVHAGRSAAAVGRWKGVRELVQYFTVPYYVWHCKGAFLTKTYGVNMLRHPEKTWYTGFAILEDYPFLVGGSPLEGLYALAALKMDAPELSLAPEVKGMCAIPADTSTVYGCPPYGVMHEEDASFKRFVDFKYTACWYRDGGFHYWTDDRILLCNPSPRETDNVLGAWREVRRHAPVRPVRTFAIVTGTKCCSRHPLKALEVAAESRSILDVVNTAEEFPFWAALAVKGNGLPNGFLIRPEELAKLTPDDVHTLVLPPLDALTEEERAVVRKLYGLGVNLVASENADGMEDVFGVRKLAAPQAVTSIGGEPSLSGAAAASYAAAGAETLLADDEGRAVLALKSNGRASAAFYTIAPSLYSRAYVHSFPRQSGEVLPRSAADLFRRMLPSPEMSLSEGRMSVCRDGTGGLKFCVMEDAQPKPAHAIAPVLTLRGDYANAVFDSSKPCTVLRKDGECLQVGFRLEPRECVTLHVQANDKLSP